MRVVGWGILVIGDRFCGLLIGDSGWLGILVIGDWDRTSRIGVTS